MILSNDGLVAFHYRSYGTFFLQQNRLHNIHRGFTHYKYYRAEKLTVEEMDYKIDKKDVYCRCKLTKIYFKEVLAMTGTETFTVLSSENLEQTSGGRMIWLVDDYYWNWPYAYSIATDPSTIRTRMTGYGNGIIP